MLDEEICFPFSFWDPLKEKLKKEEKEELNKVFKDIHISSNTNIEGRRLKVFKDILEPKMSKVFTKDPKAERKEQRLGDHKPEYIKHLSGETEVDYDTLLAFLNALWETQKEAQDDKNSRSKHAMFQVKNCCCGFEIGGRWGPTDFVLKRNPLNTNEYRPPWDPTDVAEIIFQAFGKTRDELEKEKSEEILKMKKMIEECLKNQTDNSNDNWKEEPSQKKASLFASGGGTDGRKALELLHVIKSCMQQMETKLGQRMEQMETKLGQRMKQMETKLAELSQKDTGVAL
jgi:hypothetical protein